MIIFDYSKCLAKLKKRQAQKEVKGGREWFRGTKADPNILSSEE